MALKKYNEFLSTGDGTQGSLLIPRQLGLPVLEEVEKALIPRQLARQVYGPAQIPGSSVDVQVVNENSFEVWEVAEGASIPLGTQTYTNVNVRPRKFGVRPTITREMLEDSQVPLLQLNLRQAGRELAYNENNLIITSLDGAGNTVTGGATLTVANLVTAIQNVRTNSYTPDTMLIGDEAFADLMNIDSFTEADKYGSREMQLTGFVGKIFGLNVVRFDATTAPTAAYDQRVYVFDSRNAYVIAEKRPVSVQGWDDFVHDVSGASVTQRIAVALIRSNSVALITTT